MNHCPEPDPQRLADARDEVKTFLVRKKRLSTALFVIAGVFEVVLFVLMLVFMDFGNKLYWFMFFGFLLVYSPLIVFSWRNAVKIDHLYYRLVDELHSPPHTLVGHAAELRGGDRDCPEEKEIGKEEQRKR